MVKNMILWLNCDVSRGGGRNKVRSEVVRLGISKQHVVYVGRWQGEITVGNRNYNRDRIILVNLISTHAILSAH